MTNLLYSKKTFLPRHIRAIFVWPWKMVPVNLHYLFYQPVDEKIKTWPLRFLAKENPNMEKELFDWPIMLQYDVKAKSRLISRKFSGMKFFHPSVRLTNQKATRVCIRSINQSNRSISVRLLFLFCSRVFISRSSENRSKVRKAIFWKNVSIIMQPGCHVSAVVKQKSVWASIPYTPSPERTPSLPGHLFQ